MVLAQIIAIVLVCAFIAFIIYSIYFKKRRKRLLRKLIKEGKLNPPLENTLFFEGIVKGPIWHDLQGNPVAFHALHILTKRASTTTKFAVRDINALELTYQSGDFFVQNKQDGRKYKIGISDYYEQILGFTQAYAQISRTALTGESKQQKDIIAELEANNRAAESMMQVVFNYFPRIMKSRSGFSVPLLYEKEYVKIKKVKPLANIDFNLYEFTVGKDTPPAIQKIINEKRTAEFVKEGDEIIVIELKIPIGKNVFVFGNYDSVTNSIAYRNSQIGLSISYQNPLEFKYINSIY